MDIVEFEKNFDYILATSTSPIAVTGTANFWVITFPSGTSSQKKSAPVQRKQHPWMGRHRNTTDQEKRI